MRKSLINARAAIRPLLAAGFLLAFAFTLSCSSDDGGGSGSPSGGGGNNAVYGTPVTYEGETYKTVVIGTQTWMAKNLNYNASGSVCYDDDPANCAKYGRLYDWATAMNISSTYNSTSYSAPAKHKGICPSGWHIPSDAEWGVLMTTVGGPSTAGTKLKATSGWNEGGNGMDAYGFSALPGGYGYSDGSFNNVGYRGRWWSATEDSADAYGRNMNYDGEDVIRVDNGKDDLRSVRCLQD